jgi:hypothetical protein
MNKTKAPNRCKNCGHLLLAEDGKAKHKQGNHSMYCPCRKPEKAK